MGETFSCTLCANHEAPPAAEPATAQAASQPGGDASAPAPAAPPPQKKYIRDVRIEAEMKTPNSSAVTKLDLSPNTTTDDADDQGKAAGVDLEPGRTLQRIVNFDLKEEGNHVLGVTVSYYEATDTSGRTRTFRKLYQFICKPSLIVRTKASPLAPAVPRASAASPPTSPPEGGDEAQAGDGGEDKANAAGRGDEKGRRRRRRWVLEAQLENCSEDTTELERVVLQLEAGLSYRDCNWEAGRSPRPVLHPGEVEQVCFVIEEESADGAPGVEEQDGKILFGILGIGWRTEMGQRGYLATNKLGTRHVT